MRISDLNVDGFGVWSGLELAELSDLNVFYGPNEAGKTTLMQFVRSMLYGFTPDRRARYLPPVGGGRAGGSLAVLQGERSYAISRHGDHQHDSADAIVVADGRETMPTERTLAALLGGVDEAIYSNIFAFGLREIQELGTLDDRQAADELYALALGLDRVSLIDVLRELETSRNRLLAPDDRPSLVTQLMGQRERLQGEIDELGQSTARYLAMSAQRDRLAAEIAQLEAESARLDKQSRELSLAHSLADRWSRRGAIDRQLTALAGSDTLPELALTRFEQLQARMTTCRRRLRRVKRRRSKLRDEVKRLAVNESLVRHAMRFEALGEQQPWIQSLESEIAKLEERAFDLESQLEATGATQSGSAKKLPASGLSKRSFDELRAAARALRAARIEEREFLARMGQGRPAGDLAKELESALGPAKDKGLTHALAEAGELVSQLRKRVQLDERIDQMSRREADLDDQSHEHLQNQILPTWALAGLGALFVLGCALVLLYVAGLVLPASLSGALNWPVGAVGVLAAGAAGAIKFAMERNAVGQLDGCQQQMQLLKEQLKQARLERDQLDAQLPRGGGPLVARLQAAEKSLTKLEELVPLQARHEAGQREAANGAAQAESLKNARQAAHKKWCRLLLENGLPAKTLPRELKQLARRQAQNQGLYGQFEEARQLLARKRTEYDIVAARIRQLVAEAGMVPRGERPLDQLRQGLAELAEQQKLLKVRDGLMRRLSLLRRKQEPLVELRKKLSQRYARLLRQCGATSEADFHRLAQSQAEAQRLRSQRAQLTQEIAAALEGHIAEEQLAQWLAGTQNLEQMLAAAAEARHSLQIRLTAASEQRGALGQQIKNLAEDRTLGQKWLELGTVEKRLQDALARWRVVSICGLMLSAVRDYYEREHQPQALREASDYLRRLTGGRYTRVWTPLGQHLLKVDDNTGHSLTVELLSSGTREQLFLALRLALVNSYARRGVKLPLVLDDVLVNFDVGRAKSAAIVLRDFAQDGQQILVFTCHEHIAKLFRHVKADVRLLPDNSARRIGTAEEPVKRARKMRPEAPPVPQPVVVEEADDESEAVEIVEPLVTVSVVEPAPAVEVFDAPSAILVETTQLALPPAPLVAEAEPPRPEPIPAPARPLRPTRLPRRRVTSHVQRVEWSAEEFDGELADRVRRFDVEEQRPRDPYAGFDDDFQMVGDAEAA